MSAGRVPYESLVQRVNALNYSQPILSSAVEALKSADANEILEWEDKASKVAPMVHWRVPALIDDFLALKLEHGTDLEKNLYTGMTREQFVTRLLSCRPLCFFLQEDSYLLRPTSATSRGVTGMGGFEDIGTSRERPPLVLADYLSYDEMAISALVNVAVPTHFINRGGRFNEGKRDVTGEFERHGVYVACVGTRFEVAGRMEWQTIMVTPMQNTAANGYGPPSPDDDAEQATTMMKRALVRAWARVYGLDQLPTFDEAQAKLPGQYMQFPQSRILFNRKLYSARLRLTIEPFLLDANMRAHELGTKAYVHVVGLGIGAWMVDERQAMLMTDTYAEILHELPLPDLHTIDFSWFGPATTCGGVPHGTVFRSKLGDVTAPKILFSQRDPAELLPKPTDGSAPLLLVAMYAWDSNSYPGNEYWLGMLTASGDPAAACCSTITVLQNPDVNPQRMSGSATVVYGPKASDCVALAPKSPAGTGAEGEPKERG